MAAWRDGRGAIYFLPQAAKKKKGMQMVVFPPQKFVLPKWYGDSVRLLSFPAQTQELPKQQRKETQSLQSNIRGVQFVSPRSYPRQSAFRKSTNRFFMVYGKSFKHCVNSFMPSSVLRQVHSLLHREFPTECYLVLAL